MIRRPLRLLGGIRADTLRALEATAEVLRLRRICYDLEAECLRLHADALRRELAALRGVVP